MRLIQLIVIVFCSLPFFLYSQVPVKVDETDAMRTEAMKLINSPEPTFASVPLNDETVSKDLVTKSKIKFQDVRFKMKDDQIIYARHFKLNRAKTSVILLHGALSDSGRTSSSAVLLRNALDAEVFAIDLRGHGKSGGNPGDVSYIDQYSEDLSTIVSKVRQDRPKNKIILVGHSMGGGVCLRFAMRKDKPEVDGFVLFAPLLGQNTPTYPDMPEASGPQSKVEPFLKVHFQRIIGLKILNSIGDHKLDSLSVLFFNLPKNARLRTYTYRANESMSPSDYKEGLQAAISPLLVLVGSADEAFKASAFKDAVESNSSGRVHLIDGATHNGVLESSVAMSKINNWFSSLNS